MVGVLTDALEIAWQMRSAGMLGSDRTVWLGYSMVPAWHHPRSDWGKTFQLPGYASWDEAAAEACVMIKWTQIALAVLIIAARSERLECQPPATE